MSADFGRVVLGNYLSNPTNIKILNDIIYCNSIENNIFNEDLYKSILYQVCFQITNKLPLVKIVNRLKEGLFMWKDPILKDINDQIQEQISFIENPFEVEEGVVECNKCQSKRVFSYSKQSRSADEPSTTYAECVKCGSKWQYNG